jgi:guanylate kinase
MTTPSSSATNAWSGTLLIVSAPSGAGKTTLVKALLQQYPDIVVSVSHTTRSPRAGEQNGVHYHFITREDFAAMVERGEFVEHAEVFGNFYGTSKTQLERSLSEDRDVLLEIDYQGAEQIRARLPEARSVFILPPSREVLLERLRNRGSDSPAAIATRTAAAVQEMAHHHEFDYLIVNNVFETAVAELIAVFRGERLRAARQQVRHRTLIADLLS